MGEGRGEPLTAVDVEHSEGPQTSESLRESRQCGALVDL